MHIYAPWVARREGPTRYVALTVSHVDMLVVSAKRVKLRVHARSGSQEYMSLYFSHGAAALSF